MTNPFEELDKNLSDIKILLLDILKQSEKNKSSIPPNNDFKYLPIQDIFKKKICSKPTFYKHLNAGKFTLYKFGNKSFVDAIEFEKAFHGVKLGN
jgi:hypothetical protein